MSGPQIALATILAAALAVLGWNFFVRRSRRSSGAQPPPAALVLLLERAVPLNAQYLSTVASRAVGHEVPWDNHEGSGDDVPAGDCILGESPHLIACIEGMMFLVNTVAEPYGDLEAMSSGFTELRTRAALSNHRAWVAFTVIRSHEPQAEYRIIGKLAAEFAGSGCLAILHPPTGSVLPMTRERVEEVQAALRGEDPLAAVFQDFGSTGLVPVIEVDDDPRMAAAEAEARRRFEEFEEAFREAGRKGIGREFSVKTKLTVGEHSEHIWVDVHRIAEDGSRIGGVLGNEPVGLEGMRLGSKVELDRTAIEDWCFTRDGEPVGLFTPGVIQQIEEERNARRR